MRRTTQEMAVVSLAFAALAAASFPLLPAQQAAGRQALLSVLIRSGQSQSLQAPVQGSFAQASPTCKLLARADRSFCKPLQFGIVDVAVV